MQGSRIAKHSSTLMKQLILLSFFFISLNLLARQIEEITFSYWDKPDSQIYYSIPESIDENTKIIFILSVLLIWFAGIITIITCYDYLKKVWYHL